MYAITIHRSKEDTHYMYGPFDTIDNGLSFVRMIDLAQTGLTIEFHQLIKPTANAD